MKKLSKSSPTDSILPLGKYRRGSLMCEGKRINLFKTDNPDYLLQQFKVDIEEEQKKDKKLDVAKIRHEISSYLFEYLNSFQIPTHFITKFSQNESVVRSLEMLPLVVKVYNFATKSFAKRFGVKEGTQFQFPVFEHFYKVKNRNPQVINEYHLSILGFATIDEFQQITRIASKTNAVLRSLCERRKLFLGEFQLEFGRSKGQIFIGDQLCPPLITIFDSEVQGVEKSLSDLYHCLLVK